MAWKRKVIAADREGNPRAGMDFTLVATTYRECLLAVAQGGKRRD